MPIERGRERDERHHGEKGEVEHDEPVVDRAQAGDEAVMAAPVEGDDDEADEEAEDLWREVPQRVAQLVRSDLRDADADDEQRHGDGEDGVAEERHPIELRGRPLVAH